MCHPEQAKRKPVLSFAEVKDLVRLRFFDFVHFDRLSELRSE